METNPRRFSLATMLVGLAFFVLPFVPAVMQHSAEWVSVGGAVCLLAWRALRQNERERLASAALAAAVGLAVMLIYPTSTWH